MLISASTNPPKLENMLDYITSLENTGIDYIHCDVMDGQFVSAKTFDYTLLKSIKKTTIKPLDVHLMIKNPQKTYKKYLKNGANILTLHYESFANKEQLVKLLEDIKKRGCFTGLSFKPNTSVDEILPFLCFCDVVLVMSVEPGKSGQSFLQTTFKRIKQVKDFLNEYKLNCLIEVDGGVNLSNIAKLKELGVSIVVVGNYLYSSKDKVKAVNMLR